MDLALGNVFDDATWRSAGITMPEIADQPNRVKLGYPNGSEQTITALSEDSIEWVIPLQKRDYSSAPFAKVVKRLPERAPDIHNENLLLTTSAELR